MNTETAIDDYLQRLAERLEMDAQAQGEILVELRSHLLDALDDASIQGVSAEPGIQQALSMFGDDSSLARAMNDVYRGRATTDAIIFTALPVLMTVLLRWIIFDPDGTALGWRKLLASPYFWIVALAVLFIPLVRFPKFRYALASWLFFWGITILFVIFR